MDIEDIYKAVYENRQREISEWKKLFDDELVAMKKSYVLQRSVKTPWSIEDTRLFEDYLATYCKDNSKKGFVLSGSIVGSTNGYYTINFEIKPPKNPKPTCATAFPVHDSSVKPKEPTNITHEC
jgi:hypothetical protein